LVRGGKEKSSSSQKHRKHRSHALLPSTLAHHLTFAHKHTQTKTTQLSKADPWNWNLYLFPLWAGGVLLRYAVLFPLRLALLIVGFLIFALAFFVITPLATARSPSRRAAWQRGLVKFMCQIFVASWTAVVRYHGPRPAPRPGHVWVANHTSMIDYMILCAFSPFAAIMQLHPGWVGFLQTRALGCLGCLWFNRTEVKDRALVAGRMREHVSRAEAVPLLIFPEGTCVNNRYCVMFKRGAFDLGARVCPIAIRYDPVFVDAFWNSKRQSFTSHLLALMTSWAVVCDVYFLEPQARREGESAAAFAERVQRMVADRAGLAVAPWDGYLKYYNLAAKHPDLVEKRRALFAERLRAVLPASGGAGRSPSPSPGVGGGEQQGKKAGGGGLEGLRARTAGLLRAGSGARG
jgi:glycerol-3-phosphate O-acyltransferase 3/4